jgi:hypothetical protein
VHTDVVNKGVDGLKSALNDVSAKATTLKDSAQDLGPQVDAVKSAVGTVKDTVTNLPSSGLNGALNTIGTEIMDIGTAGQDLSKAAAASCPSPTDAST